jgi:hypothetical protein
VHPPLVFSGNSISAIEQSVIFCRSTEGVTISLNLFLGVGCGVLWVTANVESAMKGWILVNLQAQFVEE